MLTTLGLRGRSASRLASLLALAALIALGAAILTPPPPTSAQQPGVPEGLELALELVDDSDNVVPAGSTITVRGQVRLEQGHEDLSISAGDLRLSAHQSWETNDRARLGLIDQVLLTSLEQGGEITASGLGSGQQLRVIAYDGNTIVARARDNYLYVFNAATGAQVGRFQSRPRANANTACAFPYPSGSCSRDDLWHGNQHNGWGRGNDDSTASSVAVWQEDEDTAWLFVGSSRVAYYDTAYSWKDMGALHIYEVDHSATTITHRRHFYAGLNELRSKGVHNSTGQSHMAYYGASVAISADGSTLAVGARRMHEVGAVYVYTRPSGGWNTLSWDDAVRVSPVVIPPWGDAANERPFEPQGTTNCDAYCRSVSSYVGDVDDGGTMGHAEFGAYVALSADGGVLAVSAPRKRFASDRTAGTGRFRGGNSLPSHGELLVFLEPAGGWSAVPNYKTGRSEIGWSASAANFDPDDHYNTGPNKRVQAPTWKFSFDWGDAQDHYLGERLALSRDGTTLAASDRHNDAVQMFQVSSPNGWASGPTAPTAQITGVDDGGRWGGFEFSTEGRRFALGDPTYNNDQGRVLIFGRPGDGTWDSATDADAELLAPTEPNDRRVANARYGRSLAWQLSGELLAASASEASNSGGDAVGPGRFWTLEAPFTCPINERTDEGGTARTSVCTVQLGDTTVVIPKGTPEGPLTISGAVTLVYGTDADGQPLSVRRSAALELRIGTVQEVAHLRLDFANDDRGTPNDVTDDRPQPSALSARGSSTVLRLQILNELEKASAAGSVASVIVTATMGTLSTEFGGGCAAGGGGATCRLNASAVSASNADNIPITLTHPGREGAARIGALVIATNGASVESEQREVLLAGTPRALGISEPAVALLNVDTPDSGADKDDRDVLTLTVTATDRLGSPVSADDRNYSYRITGPDDKRVASDKIAVQWPAPGDSCASTPAAGGGRPTVVSGGHIFIGRFAGAPLASVFSRGVTAICFWDENRWRAYEPGAGDEDFALMDAEGMRVWVVTADELIRAPARTADGQRSIRLDVNAAASAPLASGEYTLEVRQAGLPWVSRVFRLAGVPAEITLAGPETAPALDERFSLTATIVDAAGGAVPDGTAVEWGSQGVGTTPGPVRLAAETQTTDGRASAEFLSILGGMVYVTVESGEVRQLRLLQIGDPAGPRGLLDDLSSSAPNSYAVWQGEAAVAVSALYQALPPTVVLLSRASETGWKHYDGATADDFMIAPGAVLWLSGR